MENSKSEAQGFQSRPAAGNFRRPLNHKYLNVAGHKSLTIIYFFLSVITIIYLKDSLKNFIVNIQTIHNSYCKVQTAI